jgi:hypothetical protein
MSSWHFKALTGGQGRVLIGLFNPATVSETTQVRIVQGTHVQQRRVMVPAGQTVLLGPSWLTSADVTVQASRGIIPVRMATR